MIVDQNKDKPHKLFIRFQCEVFNFSRQATVAT